MTLQEDIARAILPIFDQLAVAVYHEGPYSEAEAATEAAAAVMPLVKRAQAEALDDFREELVTDQIKRYGIVMPDVREIIDDLDMRVIRLKGESDDR